jgi:hypothetical protein
MIDCPVPELVTRQCVQAWYPNLIIGHTTPTGKANAEYRTTISIIPYQNQAVFTYKLLIWAENVRIKCDEYIQ